MYFDNECRRTGLIWPGLFILILIFPENLNLYLQSELPRTIKQMQNMDVGWLARFYPQKRKEIIHSLIKHSFEREERMEYSKKENSFFFNKTIFTRISILSSNKRGKLYFEVFVKIVCDLSSKLILKFSVSIKIFALKWKYKILFENIRFLLRVLSRHKTVTGSIAVLSLRGSKKKSI